MENIEIDVLKEGVNGITPALGSYMGECAVVCFSSQGHKAGIQLKVITELEKDHNDFFSMQWANDLRADELKSHKDENRTTDFGSMAVAILLTLKLTGFTSFETSNTGTGIDFWLSNDDDELNFFGARLEVSGIRKATQTNSLDRRVKVKLDQASKSDDTSLPAYIAVIEFNKPESAFIKK
ncbi:hypothetical protein GO730_22480 [Spirosoma sp. HMF3257]|uniref:Uncharacterized protein n=1 Tax=Spirosoma telluris TaxID=2183553 RepID=A0A327NLG0_9BACT|nr:hypothetical protein [Spirosoma telluris]RAI76241.1 hypothetical protein HMF3257_22425 [Spirosoma telluris]